MVVRTPLCWNGGILSFSSFLPIVCTKLPTVVIINDSRKLTCCLPIYILVDVDRNGLTIILQNIITFVWIN